MKLDVKATQNMIVNSTKMAWGKNPTVAAYSPLNKTGPSTLAKA